MIGSFFCCISIEKGATIISVIQLVGMITCGVSLKVHFNSGHEYFIAPTVSYTLTSIFAICSLCCRGKDSDYSFRRAFFWAFISLVAFASCAYWLVLVRNYPEFGQTLCFENSTCFEIYTNYAFSVWVAIMIFNVYFAFIL